MLENALFESDRHAQTRKPATVLVSTAIHAVIIAVLILVPLFQPQVVPNLAAAIGIPLSEIPKPKIPATAPPSNQPVVQTHVQVDPHDLIAPPSIPSDIARIVESPEAAASNTYAPSIVSVTSIIRSAATIEAAAPLPPPPAPPVAAPALTAPVRVGGSVQQGNLIYQVKPTYPVLARTAHVQGTVLLEATISRDGSIENLRVISGHPLLNDAAVNAVQQWRYKPTTLNGEPVEIITTVTVTFTLQ